MTRTHTVYFGEEQLAPLKAAYEALVEDWDSRRPYIDAEAEEAGDARLDLLRGAIAILGEVAG